VQKWNWKENVDEAIDRVNYDYYNSVVAWWNPQLSRWYAYKASHPMAPLPCPITEGTFARYCLFSFNAAEPGSKLFFDANWIKRYNGGKYIQFLSEGLNSIDPRWVYSPLGSNNVNYVGGVCSRER